MKIKSNRLLSFLLAFLMFFPVFGALLATAKPALASSEDLKGEVRGNQKVFTIDKEKIENIAINTQAKKTLRRSRRSLFSDRAPSTQDANTIVNLTTKGLNNGNFDWKVFNNSEFKVTLGYTDNSNKFVEVGEMTFSEGQTKITNYSDWPLYAANAKGFQLKTDFNGNYDVRATYVSPSTKPNNNVLELNLTVYELPNTDLKVEYLDIYGKKLAKDLPVATDTAPKLKLNLGDGVEFDLPKADKVINLRDLDKVEEDIDSDTADNLSEALTTDNLNAVEKLSFTINDAISGDYTFGGGASAKNYKYKIHHVKHEKNGQAHDYQPVVSLTYQADVAIPPMKDDDPTQPVDVPTGYVRLTFIADEKVEEGKTQTLGRFDSEGTKKKYIDVKQGLKYGNAKLKAEIDKLKPYALDDKDNKNDAKPFLKWNPEIPADTEGVGTKEYNAKYKTTADLIKELGGLKGVDFGVWKGTSTEGDFWKKGVAANTTDTDKKAKIDEALADATVEDTTNPVRTTTEKGEKKGTLKVTFKDGSVYVVNESATTEAEKTNIAQTLHVYEKGQEKPDPTPGGGSGNDDDKFPKGTIFVEFTRDKTSIKEDEFKNLKSLMYAENDTVPEAKFPDAQPESGYQTVTWTPAKTTALSTTNTAYNKATKTFTFKASATKKSDKDVIPYIPGNGNDPTNPDDNNVPKKDSENNPIDKNDYNIIAFKVADDDKAKGSLTLGDKDKEQVISVLVKKNSTWAKVTVPTINVVDANTTKANSYDPAIPAKTATVENGKVYTAQFITDGQEITPGTKLPDGTYEVKVLRDEVSIKADNLYGKSYAVFKDSKLDKAKFPTPEVLNNNFKDPKWYKDTETTATEQPWTVTITANTSFKASAISANFDKENITGIEITKDPDTMTYTEGDKPKHDGIKVKLTDKNGNSVEIGKDELGTYGVTVTPSEDATLTITDHNKKPFTAKVNGKDNNGKPKELTADTKGKITVNPKKSDKDVIPYVPNNKVDPTDPNDDNVPKKDGDGNTIDTNDYFIVAFKTESTTKGTLTKGTETNQEVVSVLVKKTATDKSFGKVKKAVTVDEKAGYKFWYWGKGTEKTKVEDTATITDKDVYTGYFIKNGQEINQGDPELPKDEGGDPLVFKVEIAKGDNVKDNAGYGKTHAVFKNSTLKQQV